MQACFRIIDTLDLSYSVTARSDLVGGTSFVARVPKDLQVGIINFTFFFLPS